MNCLFCNLEIPPAAIPTEPKTKGADSGRFSCPHCNAEHVHRRVGDLPSGEPLYSTRLWGHLRSTRRKATGAKQGC